MKTKKLIEILSKLPNVDIVMSSDTEGNSFDLLKDVQVEEGFDKNRREFLEEGNGKKVIVLWP